MDIKIYDQNLIIIGIVDVYNSLTWARRYFKNGTFELSATISDNNIKLLKKHNIIEIESDSEVAYINGIDIDYRDGIKVSGVFYSGILLQRVILNSATNLKNLIENNIRSIPNFTVDDLASTITFNNSVVGKNLGDVVEALARRDNFGYKVVMDKTLKKLVFKIFYGLDRSVSQKENPRAIFSNEYENLGPSSYTNSDAGAINTVYVKCKLPAGIEQCTPPVYSIDVGLGVEKFEAYIEVDAVTYDNVVQIDASTSITKTYLDSNATLANMKFEAEKALVSVQENFEADVNFKTNYRIDYDLGDIVTIFNDDWGVSTTQRITEVAEIYEHDEDTITPTFGDPARTTLDLLKG